MNQQNYDRLLAKYPKDWVDEACSVGDGWYTLIDTLLSYLQGIEDNARWTIEHDLPRVNEEVLVEGQFGRWKQRLEEAEAILDPESDKSIKIRQVKEKFGELRFYVDGAVDHDFIYGVTALSGRMCEFCGAHMPDAGVERKPLGEKSGWIVTACAGCRQRVANGEKL